MFKANHLCEPFLFSSIICWTHLAKQLLHLMELPDVILAPHNLADFLFECGVMVPGPLTASWTPRAEALRFSFALKMPYQSHSSSSRGNMKGYLLSAERLYTQSSLVISPNTDVSWHTWRWTDFVFETFLNAFPSATNPTCNNTQHCFATDSDLRKVEFLTF